MVSPLIQKAWITYEEPGGEKGGNEVEMMVRKPSMGEAVCDAQSQSQAALSSPET